MKACKDCEALVDRQSKCWTNPHKKTRQGIKIQQTKKESAVRIPKVQTPERRESQVELSTCGKPKDDPQFNKSNFKKSKQQQQDNSIMSNRKVLLEPVLPFWTAGVNERALPKDPRAGW